MDPLGVVAVPVAVVVAVAIAIAIAAAAAAGALLPAAPSHHVATHRELLMH